MKIAAAILNLANPFTEASAEQQACFIDTKQSPSRNWRFLT
jgi:hypothetical protein